MNMFISNTKIYKNFYKPLSATYATSTPSSVAMKPRTENIANPAYKLVPLFKNDMNIHCLY